jgi:hypothetical protein
LQAKPAQRLDAELMPRRRCQLVVQYHA